MAETKPKRAGLRSPGATQPTVRATPPIVAVIDREGMVIGLLASCVEARTFLREVRP